MNLNPQQLSFGKVFKSCKCFSQSVGGLICELRGIEKDFFLFICSVRSMIEIFKESTLQTPWIFNLKTSTYIPCIDTCSTFIFLENSEIVRISRALTNDQISQQQRLILRLKYHISKYLVFAQFSIPLGRVFILYRGHRDLKENFLLIASFKKTKHMYLLFFQGLM